MKNWLYSVSCAEQTPMSAPLPLEGCIESLFQTAHMLGYDAIELHTRENAPLKKAEIDALEQAEHIRLATLVTGRLCTQGHCTLLDDDNASSERAMQGMMDYLNLAQSLQTDLVIGWVKGKIPPGGDRSAYLRRLAEKLHVLDLCAGEKGVRLFLEVINRYETNIFNTAEETAEFIRANHLTNCFVHLDTFHMSIEETDPYEAIRRCGKELGYFHVADNTRLYPGSGQLDFVRILQTLKDANYTGIIDVECLPYPDRETSARLSLEHLLACEEQLL